MSTRTTLEIYAERSPRAPPFVIFSHHRLLNGFKTQHQLYPPTEEHRDVAKEAARQQASPARRPGASADPKQQATSNKQSKQAPPTANPPTTPHQTLDPPHLLHALILTKPISPTKPHLYPIQFRAATIRAAPTAYTPALPHRHRHKIVNQKPAKHPIARARGAREPRAPSRL